MPPLGGSGLEALTDGGGGGGTASPLILQAFGVVGAPELAFLGDEDTGLYRPAADQLGLVAGGVEIARAQEVVGANQFIVAAGVIQNNAAAPSLAFGDGDTGFYESADDTLRVTLAGVARFNFDDAAGGTFRSELGNGPAMRNVSSTSGTVASLVPRQGDSDTGIGNAGDDRLAMIAGGVLGIRVIESAGVITNQLFGTTSMDIAGGPALQSEAATFNNPSIVPNKSDDDTGIGYGGADVLDLIAGASNRVRLTSGDSVFRGDWNANTSSGPALLDEGASSSNPTIVPNRADDDTGIGRDAVDGLALIAGGVDCLRVREIGGARAVGLYTTTPIVQQTGVGTDAASIHAACVAIGLFTA